VPGDDLRLDVAQGGLRRHVRALGDLLDLLGQDVDDGNVQNVQPPGQKFGGDLPRRL